jgi:hypothetical protein
MPIHRSRECMLSSPSPQEDEEVPSGPVVPPQAKLSPPDWGIPLFRGTG